MQDRNLPKSFYSYYSRFCVHFYIHSILVKDLDNIAYIALSVSEN